MNIRTTSLKLGTKQNALYFVECVLFCVHVAACIYFVLSGENEVNAK